MLFHSLAFAILLAAVLVLDRGVAHFLPGHRGWRIRCFVYLAASLVFYGGWNPDTRRWHEPPAFLSDLGRAGYAMWRFRYLGLLGASIVFDWWVGLRLEAEKEPRRRKLFLAASISLQLGVLAVFRYWNFLRDSVVAPLAGDASWMPVSDLVFPVGISFYTFKSMSYTVDVYRGIIPAERRLSVFAMFISFFPESVAGPIVRARNFLWQVQSPKTPKLPRLLEGLERFAIGFFKKAVIADNLTPLTDQVFADPAKYSSVNNAAALVAWGFVIYCDFSGYSDMAIGCARMLGFKFLENFHFPYLARSLPEFWRRWHISLSEWLRDYLYIPLGGSRHGAARTMTALLLTMLLGGLWHGASWNFVIWGAWWGAWLAIAHATRGTAVARLLPWWVTGPATFAVAMLGWVPFRCEDLGKTGAMLSRIFDLDLLRSWSHLEFVRAGEIETMRSQFLAAALATLAVVVGHVYGLASGRWRLERRDRSPAGSRFPIAWYGSRLGAFRGAWIATVFVLALLLRQAGNDSFIYFQF